MMINNIYNNEYTNLSLNNIKNYVQDNSEYEFEDLDNTNSIFIKPCMKTTEQMRIHIDDLYDAISNCENLTLHEILSNKNDDDILYKGFIDIDKKVKLDNIKVAEEQDKQYRDNIIKCFDHLVAKKVIDNYVVTTSTRQDKENSIYKISYHVYFLLSNLVYFRDPKHIVFFIQDNAEVFKKYNIYNDIDKQVYKKNGLIRIPYVHKDDPETNKIVKDSMNYIIDPENNNFIKQLKLDNDYHRGLFRICLVTHPNLYNDEIPKIYRTPIVFDPDNYKPIEAPKPPKIVNEFVFSDTEDEKDLYMDNSDYEWEDETINEMDKLLSCFLDNNKEHDLSRTEWQMICWISANENYPLNKLIKFCNRHKSYKSDDFYTEQEYQTGISNKHMPNRAKIGTLKKMIIEHEKEYIRNNYAKLFGGQTKSKSPVTKDQKLDTIEEKLFLSHFTEADFADYFRISGLSENYKFLITDDKKLSGLLYFFNGNYWEKKTTIDIQNDLNDMYFKLSNMLTNDEKFIHLRNNVKSYNEIVKNLLKLRRPASKNAIWFEIRNRIAISENIFDLKTNLIAFTNGVYELDTGIFRQGHKDDYITMTTGYDYDEKITDDRAMEFINTIMPHEDERDFMMRILSTALEGETLQKFIVFTGSGGNGKDSLIKLLKSTLGNYYYKANVGALTQKIKGDLAPNIANMNKKRMVIYNEPESGNDGAKIQCSMMKTLTGGDSVEFRNLYSSNMNTILHGTHIMCCNDKPPLSEYNEAITRRILVVPFRILFRTKEQIKAQKLEGEYLREANRFYENSEFMNDYKQSMMTALLKYYKLYFAEDRQIHAPKSCAELAQEYMEQSDEFLAWFKTNYALGTPDDFIKIADVYTLFKNSDYYSDLSKAARRQKTKKNMISEIRKNPTLKLYYRDEIDKKINNIRVHCTTVLLNWKKIEQEFDQ